MQLKNIPIGDKAPDILNAVIEIPKGSIHKFEYDEELDAIVLDRTLYSSVYFPNDYGFIPETRSPDGDLLDILVIISAPLFPGAILRVRPIGVLNMEDEHGLDWKIIAVANDDPRMDDVHDIHELRSHHLKEIQNFFEIYKSLENKKVKVGEWLNRSEALRLIEEARTKYKEENIKMTTSKTP
jgi:inorganic pyrophosphatase